MTPWLRNLIMAVTMAAAASAGAAPRDGLDVRLSAAQPVLRGDVDIHVSVGVTNVTRHPIQLLRWQLPAEDVEGALFRITREDGSPVRYTGMRIKRARPDAGDLVRLDPGATLTYDVELTGSYAFAGNGRYAIEYLSRGTHGQGVPTLQSDVMYLWLEGRSAKTSAPAAAPVAAKSLAFSRCTTTQQTAIAQAVADAGVYTANARAYLTGGGAGLRYVTWFGTNDGARYQTVRNHFVALDDAFANAAITVDCSCKKKTTYAFVYPNQPYTITVCGAFWTAPATGTDSKAGTLVHEMSHFTVVAGTDDWAYGQTAARSLAISDPTKAIDNADSHEYFAENNPVQN